VPPGRSASCGRRHHPCPSASRPRPRHRPRRGVHPRHGCGCGPRPRSRHRCRRGPWRLACRAGLWGVGGPAVGALVDDRAQRCSVGVSVVGVGDCAQGRIVHIGANVGAALSVDIGVPTANEALRWSQDDPWQRGPRGPDSHGLRHLPGGSLTLAGERRPVGDSGCGPLDPAPATSSPAWGGRPAAHHSRRIEGALHVDRATGRHQPVP